MRLKYAVAAIALLSLPVGSAMADTFWRNVLSSGATTGSTYLTFKKDRKVIAAQDDAAQRRDVAEIAAAVSDILADPDRGAAMGAAGRQFVVDNWQWKLKGERLAELL